MPSDLRGSTALITGAAVRIGRETAIELAGEGVNIVVHYRESDEKASELCSELAAKGVKAWPLRADFDKDEYEGLVKRALDAAGSLNILINNASIFPKNNLREATLAGLERNIKINAWAPFRLTMEFAALVGKGKVVNMLDSRLTGYDWNHVEYILSKHVFAELTRMTAVDLAPDIMVNGVSPGLILPPPGKPMEYIEKLKKTVPMKRHGNPAEIAAAIKYILKSDFLSGTVINVDGGRSVMEYSHGPHPD